MDDINSKHFIFILFGLGIISMKIYPTVITNNGGRDSWIALCISSTLIILIFEFFLTVCTKNHCYSLVTIYKSSFGKFLGYFLLFFLFISSFLTLIESASLQSSTIHTNMFIETPTWYILIFFLLASLYIVNKGIKPIIITTIITITLIIFSGILLFFLTYKYKNHQYLLPILKDGFTTGLLLSVVQSLGELGIVILSIPYLKFIKDKNSIKKYTLYALLFISQALIVSFIGVLATFDIKTISTITYPKLMQTQLISYWGFLESGELFVMLQTIAGWLIKYILVCYSIMLLMTEIHIKNKYYTYIATAIVFGASIYVSRNLILLFNLLNYYTYFCFLNFIVIPTFAFLIFFIKHPTH